MRSSDGRLNAVSLRLSSRIVRMPGGLERARRAGIEAICVSHRGWPSRDDYDRAGEASCSSVAWMWCALPGSCVCSAPTMIAAFPNRILNIHPSLLPSFPGVDAQRQAFEHGVKVAGRHRASRDVRARWWSDHPAARACPSSRPIRPTLWRHGFLAEEHHAYVDAVRIRARGGVDS